MLAFHKSKIGHQISNKCTPLSPFLQQQQLMSNLAFKKSFIMLNKELGLIETVKVEPRAQSLSLKITANF